MQDRETISADFADSVINKGFGRLTKPLHAFETVLLEPPRDMRKIKKARLFRSAFASSNRGFLSSNAPASTYLQLYPYQVNGQGFLRFLQPISPKPANPLPKRVRVPGSGTEMPPKVRHFL
jgi:hypothetical protein